MANAGTVTIILDANTAKLVQGIKRSQRDVQSLKKTVQNAKNSIATFAKAAVGFYAVAKAIDVAKNAAVSFTNTAAQFETFEATLTAIQGSSDAAKQSMSWIKDFAKTTPFEIGQVADSFVKLKAYGLDPQSGLMKTLGNTAAAMGKDIGQAVEAVADAVQGENERLKEFGIKASVQGQKVAYTWADSSGKMRNITIANNKDMIQSTLEAIWNEKYSGAMAARANTWQGMASNLSDSWTNFKAEIMDAGLFDYFKGILKTVSQYLGGAFDKAKGGAKGFSDAVISGIKSSIKAAAVLGDTFSAISGAFSFVKAAFWEMVGILGTGINTIQSAWNKLGNTMSTLWATIANGIKSIFAKIINYIVDKINSFAGVVNKAATAVKLDPVFDKLDHVSFKETEADIVAIGEPISNIETAWKYAADARKEYQNTFKDLGEGGYQAKAKQLIADIDKNAKSLRISEAGVNEEREKASKLLDELGAKEGPLADAAKKSAQTQSKALKNNIKLAKTAQEELAKARLFNAGGDELVKIAEIGNRLAELGKSLTQAELAEIYDAEMAKMGKSTQDFYSQFEQLFDTLANGGDFMESLKSLGVSLSKDIFREPLEDLASAFNEAFAPVMDGLKDMFKDLFNGAGGIKDLIGEMFGSVENSIGSVIGIAGGTMVGGGGTGASIGSTLGTAVGTAFGGPVGAAIGGMLGGFVGGLFDGDEKKKQQEEERKKLLEEQTKALLTVSSALEGFNLTLTHTYSDALAQAVGGADEFASAMGKFKSTFFNDAELKEMARSQLELALAQHGVTLGSKEQMKALILETQNRILALKARIQIAKADILAEQGTAEARAQATRMKLEAEKILSNSDVAAVNEKIKANNAVVISSKEASKAAIGFGRAVYGSIKEMTGKASDALLNAEITDTIDVSDITSPLIANLESQLASAQSLYGTLMSNMDNFSTVFSDSVSSAGSAATSASDAISQLTQRLLAIADFKEKLGADKVEIAKYKLDIITEQTGLTDLTLDNALSEVEKNFEALSKIATTSSSSVQSFASSCSTTASSCNIAANSCNNLNTQIDENSEKNQDLLADYQAQYDALLAYQNALKAQRQQLHDNEISILKLQGIWGDDTSVKIARANLAFTIKETELLGVTTENFLARFNEAMADGYDKEEIENWNRLSDALQGVQNGLKNLAKDLFDLQEQANQGLYEFSKTDARQFTSTLRDAINRSDYVGAKSAYDDIISATKDDGRLTYKDKIFQVARANNMIQNIKDPNKNVVDGLALLRKEQEQTNKRLEKIEQNTYKSASNADDTYQVVNL